jgi:antitoxin (DNA-binding transcriptional repressor) of toxin-antitoxin stability system
VNASAVLALVKQGETIEITERGTPVALLTPLPSRSTFQRWVNAGLVTEATNDLRDAVPLGDEVSDSLSRALEELRADDGR